MAIRILSIVLFLLVAAPGMARDVSDPYGEFRPESERDEFYFDESLVKKWKEGQTEVPGLPKDNDLKELEFASVKKPMRVFIDLKRLGVGEDRVTRYWVVLKSPGGGYNATFEGLRCNTKEYKVYAYGHPERNPQVRPVKEPEWKKYTDNRYGNFREELGKVYLCNGITQRTPREVDSAARGQFAAEHPYTNYYSD